MRTINLPDGGTMPVLGLGTWMMGERKSEAAGRIAALKLGLDLGARPDRHGGNVWQWRRREVVGEAIAGRRDRDLPRQQGAAAQCQPQRHGGGLRAQPASGSAPTGIDLYLLHWRGSRAARRNHRGVRALKRAGKIRRWGVSNFDVADMGSCAVDGAGCRQQSGALQPHAPRHRMRSPALVPRAPHAGHGLFADRARPHPQQPRAGIACAKRTGVQRRRNSRSPGCSPRRRRDRHSQGHADRPCPRELRRARSGVERCEMRGARQSLPDRRCYPPPAML